MLCVKSPLLRECHSCFPELRLQYLEESQLTLSSTAGPRKHDIMLKQKRESWQIYWDGCDYSTHLAGQPLWKRHWLAALQHRGVCAVRVYSSSLQPAPVSQVLNGCCCFLCQLAIYYHAEKWEVEVIWGLNRLNQCAAKQSRNLSHKRGIGKEYAAVAR